MEKLERRSVRRYTPDQLSERDLEQILGAAITAPSFGDLKLWSLILTTDSEVKGLLFQLLSRQPMIIEAPYFLTFCADFNRVDRWFVSRGGQKSFNGIAGLLLGVR